MTDPLAKSLFDSSAPPSVELALEVVRGVRAMQLADTRHRWMHLLSALAALLVVGASVAVTIRLDDLEARITRELERAEQSRTDAFSAQRRQLQDMAAMMSATNQASVKSSLAVAAKVESEATPLPRREREAARLEAAQAARAATEEAQVALESIERKTRAMKAAK